MTDPADSGVRNSIVKIFKSKHVEDYAGVAGCGQPYLLQSRLIHSDGNYRKREVCRIYCTLYTIQYTCLYRLALIQDLIVKVLE